MSRRSKIKPAAAVPVRTADVSKMPPDIQKQIAEKLGEGGVTTEPELAPVESQPPADEPASAKANGHGEPETLPPEAEAPPLAEPEQEKVPEPESVLVPSALLLAAESVTPSKDPGREYLQGVFLHYKDGKGRVVSTDGHRMFVASFGVMADKVPSWMRAKLADAGGHQGGLILSNTNLRSKLAMIVKTSESSGPLVRLTWTKGNAKVEVSDLDRELVFQAHAQHGDFPNYEAVIPAETFGALDEEGNVTAREWEPIGINSRYLKDVGDVAKILEAGMPKTDRSKNGMVVRAFAHDADRPIVFDFSTAPGVVLILGAAKLASPALSTETAKLLAGPVKLTIAALRAHATRNYGWAADAKDPAAKAAFRKKAEAFEARIADVMKMAPGIRAIAHTPAAKLPDEKPAAEAAE